MTSPESIHTISRHILEKIDNFKTNATGIILGSGLGEAITRLDSAIEIPYSDIPVFPQSTVKGHSGSLIYGFMEGKPVLVFSGRFHIYEGYSAAEACTPVRVMGELGIKRVFITNAAGALNPQFDAGDLMLITDQINFTGHSPLTGPNNDDWGVRFPDMSKVYCDKLRALAISAAKDKGVRLERGVYVQVTGPNLETPAETRMFKRLGADAVGMSTVPEAIVAAHMGMKIIAFSIISDLGIPGIVEKITHEEVLKAAQATEPKLTAVLKGIL